MQRPSPQEVEHAHVLEDEDRKQKCGQFKGVRMRKWGSWVSEIRMPKSREKLWLGSYPTVEQAARAYDAAVYCLRGPTSKFNFPNSVPDIPSASSLSRRQIQAAAAKYARDKLPSSPPTLQEKEIAREDAASPSRSASVSEAEGRSDCQQILEEDVLNLWESGSDSRDSWHTLNLERIPSIDDALAMELNSCVWQEQQQQEEEHGNTIVDPTELWNF